MSCTGLAVITSNMLKKLRPFKQIAALGGSAAFASTLLISSATPSFASQVDCGNFTCTLFLSRSEVRTVANTGEIGLVNEGISAIPVVGQLLSLPSRTFYHYVSSAARQNKCLRIPFWKPPGVGLLGFYPYSGLPPAGGVRCQEVL